MTCGTDDWCISIFNLADKIGDGKKHRTATDSEK